MEESELRSDFSKWHKYDDFHFTSKKLNPCANPEDVQMGTTRYGATVTFDMISDGRKQKVPDCIKEEIIYCSNTMLDEKLVDIENVRFLLHAEISFETVGSLFNKYRVRIVMVDKKGNQLHKNDFCLCDCGKEQENEMVWDNISGMKYFLIKLFALRRIQLMATDRQTPCFILCIGLHNEFVAYCRHQLDRLLFPMV